MSASKRNEQEILEALRRVPDNRWPEVLSYVRSLLSTKDEGAVSGPIATAQELANSELVGLWLDRSHLGDSQAYALQLRQQAEQRRGAAHAPG